MNSSADQSIHFYCLFCKNKFESLQFEIVDAPEQHHQWNYFCNCPICYEKSSQISWQKGSFAALGKQTGPTTEAGIAAVSKNLEGHPTQEEMQRIRFNAITHGINAKVARFHPPKPGSYPSCSNCEYLADQSCRKLPACVKKTEIFMRVSMAFEHGDPEMIKDLHASNQSNLFSLMHDMFLTVIGDGVAIRSPKMYYDKDGLCHIFKYKDDKTGEDVVINEVQQHPLLKPLIDLMSKNKMSLEDLNLTPKVQDDQDILRGHLSGNTPAAPVDAQQYLSEVKQGTDALLELIKNGQNQIQAVENNGE